MVVTKLLSLGLALEYMVVLSFIQTQYLSSSSKYAGEVRSQIWIWISHYQVIGSIFLYPLYITFCAFISCSLAPRRKYMYTYLDTFWNWNWGIWFGLRFLKYDFSRENVYLKWLAWLWFSEILQWKTRAGARHACQDQGQLGTYLEDYANTFNSRHAFIIHEWWR
jgi:hypothetical protein